MERSRTLVKTDVLCVCQIDECATDPRDRLASLVAEFALSGSFGAVRPRAAKLPPVVA